MQIILEHNTTHFKRYFEDVEVIKNTPLYQTIKLDVSRLQDGDYTIILLSEMNEILIKEILRIGDYQIKEYKQVKKYTQYARK